MLSLVSPDMLGGGGQDSAVRQVVLPPAPAKGGGQWQLLPRHDALLDSCCAVQVFPGVGEAWSLKHMCDDS